MYNDIVDYFGSFPITYNGIFSLFFVFVLVMFGFSTLCAVLINIFKRR